jgi:FixJ family two-component response regulator
MDAVALIESLASQSGTNSIPIMVLSTDADLDRVAQVHQAGASDFLVVPYQPEVLQEKVVRLLDLSRNAMQSREKAKATVG